VFCAIQQNRVSQRFPSQKGRNVKKVGTHYFVHLDKCKKCGRYTEVHIGKSSGGCRFLFQFVPNRFEKIPDWMEATADNDIYDEYEHKLTFTEFWTMIDIKQKESRQCGLQGFRDVDGYDFLEGDFQ
jgi:hypothetical protein